MISSCEIRNFRCFKLLRQTGLKRFTFLVGASGTGKTAFLEAIFLSGGSNPEIYFRVRRWRGLGEVAFELSGSRQSYEELFRDMFFDFKQDKDIMIRSNDANTGERTLQIYYHEPEAYSLPLKGLNEHAFLIKPITFKWITPKKVIRSEIVVKEGQLRMTGSSDVYPIIMISPQLASARQNALRFSELSKQNKIEPVKTAIRFIFPEIEDITLESIAGELVIHVSLNTLQYKLPIVDLSGGMNKYLSILLSIVSNPGGVVLVDEIEDGFYFKTLPSLLNNMVELCEEHEVQLIASTHSYEFLETLGKVISAKEGRDEDFTLLRFEKGSNLQPTVKSIRGQSYEAAIEKSFEVR
jgi:AAA15 family ATPase/GTPase